MSYSSPSTSSWASLQGWPTVAGALRLYFVVALVQVGFGLVVAALSATIASSGDLEGVLTIVKVSAYVGLAISIAGLVALQRYTHVPVESGARGTAQAAFILAVVNLALSIMSVMPLLRGVDLESASASNAWDLISSLCTIAQIFCFLASLRTMAGFIGRWELHKQAGTVMTLVGIVIGLVFFTGVISAAQVVALVLVFGIATLGIGIWALVLFLILVSRLARAVTDDVTLPSTFA